MSLESFVALTLCFPELYLPGIAMYQRKSSSEHGSHFFCQLTLYQKQFAAFLLPTTWSEYHPIAIRYKRLDNQGFSRGKWIMSPLPSTTWPGMLIWKWWDLNPCHLNMKKPHFHHSTFSGGYGVWWVWTSVVPEESGLWVPFTAFDYSTPPWVHHIWNWWDLNPHPSKPTHFPLLYFLSRGYGVWWLVLLLHCTIKYLKHKRYLFYCLH